jgi:hypothetical protein
MFFRKQYEARVGKDEMIMSELLSNAFRSVQYQIKASPLCDCLNSSDNRARCRLNLYAMNIGILNYFLVSKLNKNAKFYVHNLGENLVKTICHADPQVVENIKELILDEELISRLIDRTQLSQNYNIISKKDLLQSYISYRVKEYNYAIGLKIKLLNKSDSKNGRPYFTDYPVTKIFSQDYLGRDKNVNSDFSVKFAHNISMRSINLFSEEIDELFS